MTKPIAFLRAAVDKFNPRKALRHPITKIRDAAKAGDADAQYQLGEAYLAGWYVSRQPLIGANWLLRAADQGHARARHSLSLLYMTGARASGDAAWWLAESQTQSASHRNAALLYPEGLDVAPDARKAFAFAHAAAEQGFGPAQANLGMFYLRAIGCPADLAQARAWSLRAAEQKEPVGSLALGIIHEHGFGVARDLAAAAAWYAMAAELGNDAAATALGLFYFDGLGVERDVARARLLLTGPASRGNDMAKTALAEIQTAMDTEAQSDPDQRGVKGKFNQDAMRGAM